MFQDMDSRIVNDLNPLLSFFFHSYSDFVVRGHYKSGTRKLAAGLGLSSPVISLIPCSLKSNFYIYILKDNYTNIINF